MTPNYIELIIMPYICRMIFKRVPFIVAILLVFTLVTPACKSEYQKTLKGTDIGKKYELAKKYYNKNDYFRALELFEELVTVYRGSDEAEEIYYFKPLVQMHHLLAMLLINGITIWGTIRMQMLILRELSR